MSKIESIKEEKSSIYLSLPLNDLVLYAIGVVAQIKSEINYADIIAAAYMLFPKKFYLEGYNNWPDSNIINKRIVDLRHRNSISGSVAQGFSLTLKGQKLINDITNRLSSKQKFIPKTNIKNISDNRTRARRFQKHITSSEAYNIYKENKNLLDINEYQFRSMLFCPMESPLEELRTNLTNLKEHILLLQNEELIDFLDKCKSHFTNILNKSYSDSEKAGMLKQKRK